ncbi:Lipoprotein-releasing system ATP-binding protein LolD [Candidatus Clavichlamydia salmonicola]|uniref:ABC transporter ATP-binding protein n=1 Tax=Candidatus Clavichlamydia salmonicola TaxID=469812 RepID=UPI0018919D0E|nr:ABC transporter ATP-binding protein [Candidatus Clavichlamydia salmonicola]MBF5050855.1 Lipoprotein-releasing system ATP-binding protein LolD [Candidatus Clavichlamydia salmonicola]
MVNKSPTLFLKKISKGFQTDHSFKLFLNDISLSLFSGQSMAITGSSGSGKTTLLHIAGGLLKPDQGSVTIKGKNPFSHDGAFIRNRCIGSIFQFFHLLDDYDVLGNVIFPALINMDSRRSKKEIHKQALDLLSSVGMDHRIHASCQDLSGGEKQRVAIARALINEPDLILADEPSGNLDQGTAKNIHELLLELATEKNYALLIVTHNPLLSSLCDIVYQLEKGKLIA